MTHFSYLLLAWETLSLAPNFMHLRTAPQGMSLKHAPHPELLSVISRSLSCSLGLAFKPLLTAGCVTSVLITAAPVRSAEVVLYKLETQCSQRGGASINCMVEAVNAGASTRYRHHLGKTIETVRISDDPLTMSLWKPESKQWQTLHNASGRFSTNTVCFNDQDLCVINPNYLNSVRQDNPTKLAGRDLVRVHFGSDGRIDASCYDAGCELVKP